MRKRSIECSQEKGTDAERTTRVGNLEGEEVVFVDRGLMSQVLRDFNFEASTNDVVGQNDSDLVCIPVQFFSNNADFIETAWYFLINRLAVLENRMKECKIEQRRMEANIHSPEVVMERFKASVEATHMSAKKFVESRNFNPAAIQRGIEDLWPSFPRGDANIGTTEYSSLRQAAIIHIWECYAKGLGVSSISGDDLNGKND